MFLPNPIVIISVIRRQRIFYQLIGDFYTVGEVLGHTLAGIDTSLGMSMNFEAVRPRYVDVRLERKKEVLDAYHAAIHTQPKQPDEQKALREKQKRSAEIGR